jgi:hypothetical protein
MEEQIMKGLLIATVLLVALLVSVGYTARDTHTMRHWHPMLVEPALGYFGISFFGHEHTPHEHPVKDGAFVRAPITSCWNYDFLEKDCDGPDHYKAFISDGSKPDSRIGAYKGDPGAGSPPRAKACAVNTNPYREYCVSDYLDDGKIVWRETHHNLDSHTLAVGCPGPRLELPCRSRD